MNSKETISHCHISQEIEKIFTYLKDDFLQILQNNLIGIYIHGSIALNDFRKATSDIDMLVVTNDCPSDIEKEN